MGATLREKFYSAAHLLPSANIMSVIAWAFQYKKHKKLPHYSNNEYIKPIVSFLFWTTILQSNKYGRNRFYRDTFSLSWEAGNNKVEFPYNKEMKELCFDYEFINGKIPKNPSISTMLPDKRIKSELRNVDKIFELMHHQPNKGIFLSLYQKITHEKHDKVEWIKRFRVL